MSNLFFKNHGPFTLKKLLLLSKINILKKCNDIIISDVKDLDTAEKNNITFFHSKKYEDMASKTKAAVCITSNNLSHILPSNCEPISVDNVLIENQSQSNPEYYFGRTPFLQPVYVKSKNLTVGEEASVAIETCNHKSLYGMLND